MNRTVMFIGIVAVVCFGFAGFVTLTALGQDASTFAAFATATLATTVGAGVTLYQISQLREGQKVIAKSVNGNTERMLEVVGHQLTTEERARVEASQSELRGVAENG